MCRPDRLFYLPGSYDPLAAPLSLMARTVGVLGLLLVPIGAVWHARPRYALAVTALVVLTIVCMAVSLVALMSSGYALGAATLLAALGGLWRLKSRLEAEPRHYERSGDAYNVVFEQVASNPATREFVVYNPLDRQVFTSHRMALLQHADQIENRRGYFAVHPTQHAHWKYFWFD